MLGMKTPLAIDPIKVEHDVKLPVISVNTEKLEALVVKAGKGALALYAGKVAVDVLGKVIVARFT